MYGSHLKKSLQLFPGIGEKKEKQLLGVGVYDWQTLIQYQKKANDPLLPNVSILEERWEELEREFQEANFSFFTKELPSLEYWRLWQHFPERFCFLDIETTGISESSVTTVVSLFQDETIRTFERGKDLEFLFDVIEPEDIIVTYNGRRFDIPFLEREFHYRVKNPQLDLMNLLHSIGIKGGLKKSEIQLGLVRPEAIAGMDGREAPLLWFEYQRTNNIEALEKLIAYNREDTKNLKIVLEKTIGLLTENLLF
ncbi:rnase H family [Leptospira yanagawae serovar Saopaulo str. Sao Paulo = ATCC 700523]|uniref:Exonuclease n=2 Tax=Leptospira yanagawae TaxID=293069 RepID=A0ABY2M6D6_9LEPT|nr:ribonuclease H-like domain-containing protein [Leptospira yanagawae]EOQ87666.1 rnase H family [Leptospira yanagawae serovar Saopaulo str. Sao Paulo = ATCC 700523]TGL21898.1 exonuclease [Leptospira yanagawae]